MTDETTRIDTRSRPRDRGRPRAGADRRVPAADHPPLMATATAGPSTDIRRFGPSVPTVLWGLILALVASLAIVHQVSDVDLNLTVLVPVVLLAVGAALVAWGIAGLARERR